MQQATDKVISKVFKGPSGESEYGPWQLYNIYFVGSENKYGYMHSGQKPIPVKGMKIAYLEFETEKKVVKGKEYINRNVKVLKLKDTPEAQIKPIIDDQPEPNGKAYIDHGKCVLELMAIAEYDESRLAELIEIFKQGIEQMTSSNSKSELKEPPPPNDEDFIPDDLEDIPF